MNNEGTNMVRCESCGKLVPASEITWFDPFAAESTLTLNISIPVKWCPGCTRDAVEESW